MFLNSLKSKITKEMSDCSKNEPSQFSPVTVKESPSNRIARCGNLTGGPRNVRDLAAELYNLIQTWNAQHLLGVQVLNNIMQLKLDAILSNSEDGEKPSLYPDGLQEQCDQLEMIIEKLDEISLQLRNVAQRMAGVVKLENFQKKVDVPMFLTWPIEKFSNVCSIIYEAYSTELRAKKRVKEKIAHCDSKQALMYHMATWVHQPYVDSKIDLAVESLLLETGHR